MSTWAGCIGDDADDGSRGACSYGVTTASGLERRFHEPWSGGLRDRLDLEDWADRSMCGGVDKDWIDGVVAGSISDGAERSGWISSLRRRQSRERLGS